MVRSRESYSAWVTKETLPQIVDFKGFYSHYEICKKKKAMQRGAYFDHFFVSSLCQSIKQSFGHTVLTVLRYNSTLRFKSFWRRFIFLS